MNNIKRYNYINLDNARVPNYNLKLKYVFVEFRISYKGELLLIGRLDENYICWYSITTIEDRDINVSIFNYIVSGKWDFASNEFYACKDRFDEIKNWLCGSIDRSYYKGMKWNTPFESCYGEENSDMHGELFAKDIVRYFNKQKDMSTYRIADGNYISILERYYQLLVKSEDADYMYYYKIKPIISILKQERYLAIADDSSIRDLYNKCVEAGSSLYNRYMPVVR